MAATCAGCTAAPRPLPWDVSIGDAALRGRVRALVATVREGGCTGAVVWTLAYRPSAPPSASPPELGPGSYAFEIVARDAACAPIARGCTESTLPLASGSRITVSLTATTAPAACVAPTCSDGLCQTDDAGPRDAGPDAAIDAALPPQDVGPPDAALTCAAGNADCNFDRSDACETTLDRVTDCRACGLPCDRPHATPTCGGGTCAVAVCDAAWGNCNGIDSDGCEASLETTNDCGGCGTACSLAHAVSRCGAAGCEVASCHAGWADCDGVAGTGCEASLASAATCGACGVACSALTPVCAIDGAGVRACALACTAPTVACGTSCVDTTTAASDCGLCGTVCQAPHAALTCSASVCGGMTCDAGWADCNGLPGDGCERSVQTATDCGTCGTACSSSATAETTCASGSCAVVACAPGRIDCDGTGSNGCETDAASPTSCGACEVACGGATPLCAPTASGGFACAATCAAPLPDVCAGRCVDDATDAANCGACANVCSLPDATAICRGGLCRVQSCSAGLADCNGDPSDGCETDPSTDVDHCGGCGDACPVGAGSTASCSGGVCSFACEPGRGDCDGMPSTGCERALNTATDCGGCGIPCDPAGTAIGDCSTGTCVITGGCSETQVDCDGEPANGCESDLLSDRRHCGACARMCTGMTGTCCNGSCARDCP